MGRDAGIGLILLEFCGLLYWQTALVSAPSFVPIGPAFYPRVILILLAALSVWLILETFLRRRAPARAAKKPAGPASDYRRVLLGFFVFLGYVVSLSVIGFVSGTFLFLLGLGWAVGPRKTREIPKLLAVAAGTAVVTYLVFEKYLYVFLPRGFFF
jgi:putative tricarboxylic transport membrane protein